MKPLIKFNLQLDPVRNEAAEVETRVNSESLSPQTQTARVETYRLAVGGMEFDPCIIVSPDRWVTLSTWPTITAAVSPSNGGRYMKPISAGNGDKASTCPQRLRWPSQHLQIRAKKGKKKRVWFAGMSFMRRRREWVDSELAAGRVYWLQTLPGWSFPSKSMEQNLAINLKVSLWAKGHSSCREGQRCVALLTANLRQSAFDSIAPVVSSEQLVCCCKV